MEKPSLLDTLLSKVLQIAYDIMCLLLICPRHIPCAINHLLTLRQELIQVVDTLGVLFQELAFAGLRFPTLDEVKNHDRGSVSGE